MNPASPSITLIPNSFSFGKKVNEQLGTLLQEIRSLDSKSPRGKVHDLRVLTRRLQATLSILSHWASSPEATALRKKVEQLTSFLGPVRSFDVSYLDLKKRLEKEKIPFSPSFDFLMEWFRRKRKKLRKEIAQTIAKRGVERSLKKLTPLSLPENQDVPSLTEVLLKECQKAGQRVFRRWQRFEKKERIADLHDVRIALKKWRYLLEIQSEFTGSPSLVHLKEMKSIQDRLGLIHDAEVLRDLIGKGKIRRDSEKAGVEKTLQALRTELKSEIKSGVKSFHQEGEEVLLKLFTERTRA